MALSTGRELHVQQHLSEIAIAYRPQGMIADMIAPIIIVNKQSDTYPVFNQGEALAVPDTTRSPGTRAKRITRSVSSAQYTAKNYALARDIVIEDIANMDAAYQYQLGVDATHIIVDGLMLDWDKPVLGMIGSSTNVATGFVPNSAWNAGNTANAGDPVQAIWTGMEQQQSLTAYKPNSLLFGWKAWNWARRNYHFRNYVLGLNNGGGAVTRQAVANAFEVERLLVADAFYNSANEAMTASLRNTFPADAVLLYYAPTRPSRDVPSFMYSMRWANPALPSPLSVERHPYDSQTKMESIEAGYYQDEKITASTLGHLILGVGSAQANGI